MNLIPGYSVSELVYEDEICIICRVDSGDTKKTFLAKTLKNPTLTHQEIANFKHEVRVLQENDITGVPKVISNLEDQGSFTILSEDFKGITLMRYIADNKISLAIFFDIAIQIATVISEIHSKGLVHKSINPSTILYSPKTSELRIIDFSTSSSAKSEILSSTTSQPLKYSLPYMSPEQTGRLNQSLDYRTDFYSLGVVLYELATGRLPFQAKDLLELVHAQIALMPENPSEVNPSFPKQVSNLILKLMAKSSDDRYQNPTGLIHDLMSCNEAYRAKGFIPEFVLGELDYSDQLRIPNKLYGRDKELRLLKNAINEVFIGAHTNVFISGEAGVGKTKLVNQLKLEVLSKGGQFVEAKFDQFNKNVPYSGIVAAFEDLINQLLQESDAQLDRMRSLFQKSLGQNLGLLVELIPSARIIFGDLPPIQILPGKESENRFRLTLRTFLNVFSDNIRPLTAFLDDIQWADTGSLNLLKWLIENASSKHILFITAYRNDQTSQNPAFEQWLKEIDLDSLKTSFSIELFPLVKKDVQELISETLLRNQKEVKSLSDVIFQKTAGNPYFISEILRQIQDQGLLSIELTSGKAQWTWKEDQIASLTITDNVVDLVLQRTKMLSQSCIDVLSVASCINKTFEFNTLKEVLKDSPQEVLGQLLQEAMESELIYPIDDNHRYIAIPNINLNARFSFAHDRVQQVFYAIYPEEESRKTHLILAKLGISNLTQPELTNDLLNIAAHYVIAHPILKDPEDSFQAALYLTKAGVKTKENNAPAAEFLDIAISLLPKNSWENYPEVTFQAFITLAESEFIQGKLERSEKLFQTIEKESKVQSQRITAIGLKMILYIFSLRFEEAIHEGKKALLINNYSLKQATEENIGAGMGEILGILGSRKPTELIQLNRLTEEVDLLNNDILAIILPSAFLSGNGNLWTITVLEVTKILLTKGLSLSGALGMSSFGMIMGSILGDKIKAFELGEVALEITKKLGDPSKDGQLNFVSGAFLSPWVKEYSYVVNELNESITNSLKYGDLAYMGYSIQVKCGMALYHARPQVEFLQLIDQMKPLVKSSRMPDTEIIIAAYEEILLNEVNGRSNGGTLLGKPQQEKIGELLGLKMFNAVGLILNLQNINHVIHNRYEESIEAFGLLSQLEEAFFANIMVVIKNTFYVVAKAQIGLTLEGEEREILIKELRAILESVKSQNQANNKLFRNSIALIEAMVEWLDSGEEAGIKSLEIALNIAQETSNLRNSALISEFLFRIFLKQGKASLAKSHFSGAISNYAAFQSNKKVDDLKSEFPQMTLQIQQSSGRNPFMAGEQIDYLSIIKSNQVLNGEMDIETLVKNFLNISKENAGAQRGKFLRKINGEWITTAQNGEWNIQPIETRLPFAIINFVEHTREITVIDDATNDEKFSKDPYIISNDLKSLICVPIKFRANLKGIIYLENNLTYGAFGNSAKELLNLLSTQIGISIENSELYASLEENNRNLELKVKERTSELNKLYSENEMLLLNMLPSNIAQRLKAGETYIADNYENVSVVFLDIVNFTTISEKLSPKKLVVVIHEYFKLFDEIFEKYGLEKIKTIGDAYLAVSGIPNSESDHAQKCVLAAKELMNIISRKHKEGGLFEIRAGISSGPVVAGIVGVKKFAYDIWGDTVNTAARMEQNSNPNKINISGSTYELIKNTISCTYRGKIAAKNKGMIDMYFVD